MTVLNKFVLQYGAFYETIIFRFCVLIKSMNLKGIIIFFLSLSADLLSNLNLNSGAHENVDTGNVSKLGRRYFKQACYKTKEPSNIELWKSNEQQC